MRLIQNSGGKYLFHLGKAEKDLLTGVLKLYPCIPAGHRRRRVSRSALAQDAKQVLLDEALAEQRAKHRTQVQALVADKSRWAEKANGWRLSLTTGEVEWLLQVLNDIRVGSWMALGSPEELKEVSDEKMAPHYWAMEVAGLFQVFFLEVLEGLSS